MSDLKDLSAAQLIYALGPDEAGVLALQEILYRLNERSQLKMEREDANGKLQAAEIAARQFSEQVNSIGDELASYKAAMPDAIPRFVPVTSGTAFFGMHKTVDSDYDVWGTGEFVKAGDHEAAVKAQARQIAELREALTTISNGVCLCDQKDLCPIAIAAKALEAKHE